MQEVIGFTWQKENSGACGKLALRHALLLLGIPVTPKAVDQATGLPKLATKAFGTSQKKLTRALQYFGCTFEEVTRETPELLREALDKVLESGSPAILSVEADEHWAVIAGKAEGDSYWWIDSVDDDLIGKWRWADVVDWIDNSSYYFLAVKPNHPEQFRHSLVGHFGQVAPLLEDDDLREFWGYYLEDLREAFDCPVREGNGALTAEQFFARFGTMIAEAARNAYEDSDWSHIKWEIDSYRKVATMHHLLLSEAHLPEALTSLTAAMTAITCTED